MTETIELEAKTKESYASNFYIMSMSNEKIRITGVMIAEGIWKGVHYLYDEMKSKLSEFKKVPVIVMHGKDPSFGTKPVGKIVKLEPNESLRCLVFQAEITDNKAIEGIKNGVYDAVSIKGGFEKLENINKAIVGRDYTPMEVSLTGSPACDRCMIFSYEELSNAFKGDCEDITMKEGLDMSKPVNAPMPQPTEVELKAKRYAKCKSLLDMIPASEEYKAFMDECLKRGGDFVSCATQWKEAQGKEETPEEVPEEPIKEVPSEPVQDQVVTKPMNPEKKEKELSAQSTETQKPVEKPKTEVKAPEPIATITQTVQATPITQPVTAQVGTNGVSVTQPTYTYAPNTTTAIPEPTKAPEPQKVEVVVKVEQPKVEEKPVEAPKPVETPVPNPVSPQKEEVAPEKPKNPDTQEERISIDQLITKAKEENRLADLATYLLLKEQKKRESQ